MRASSHSLARVALPVLALLGAARVAPAEAQSVWGRSSTYLRGFVRPAGTDVATYVPFLEMVELHARRLGVEGLSLHTGFWGQVDVVDLQDRYRASGDVSTLFLQYRAPEEGKLRFLRGLEVTAGRQFVALGPTLLEQLDGGKVHYHHPSGVEVGIFGGVPTGMRVAFQPWPLDEDRTNYGNSWLLGGRLGYIDLGRLAGGVSFVHRRYRDRIADSDLGLDLSTSPLDWLDLSGSGVVSLEAQRLKDGRATISLQPWRKLSLDLGYHFSSPDLWLPRTSIFAVFAEEAFQEASIEARLQVTRRFSLDADYGRRFYSYNGGSLADGSEGANRAGLRATMRFGEGGAGRGVAELERIESPDNAANRLRLATLVPFSLGRRPLNLIVDLDLLILDEVIREARLGFTAAGYLELSIARGLRLLAGGSGGTSPLLRKEGSVLARLIWDFEAPVPEAAVQVSRGRMP